MTGPALAAVTRAPPWMARRQQQSGLDSHTHTRLSLGRTLGAQAWQTPWQRLDTPAEHEAAVPAFVELRAPRGNQGGKSESHLANRCQLRSGDGGRGGDPAEAPRGPGRRALPGAGPCSGTQEGEGRSRSPGGRENWEARAPRPSHARERSSYKSSSL